MNAWIVEPVLTPDGRGTGCYDVYENTERGRFVATVDHKTDAALVGTAPELLEALIWAVDQLDDDLDLDHRQAIQAARAVIAKAKGHAI